MQSILLTLIHRIMKKLFFSLAFLSIFSLCFAEEYCNMGFCFEVPKKFHANAPSAYLDANQQPTRIIASKGLFTLMTIYKNYKPEMDLMERVEFLKDLLDKAMANQTQGKVPYFIDFSQGKEYLGEIETYCLTGYVHLGLGATQYKFYLFDRDDIPYLVEFSTPGGTKGFEKNFRAMIESFKYQEVAPLPADNVE